MKPCPACKQALEPAANFCSRCGCRQAIAPLVTDGDRRVVTVVFADVTGFTAMSEQLDPEQVTEIVNQCFQALTTPIYRYGGVVDKYIGDAIMAIFGAPVSHEDDPERAGYAALAMQEAAMAFSTDLERRTGLTLKVRIGLNTGLVVAGSVGGDQKRDYTVMGDTVNLAQRMEATAQPGSILVTQETHRLTAHAFAYRSVGPIPIKGKVKPVTCFELLGTLDPSATRILPTRTIGREREISALLDLWQGVRSGMAHWITLQGDAGIGKTQVVDEFIRRVGDEAVLLSARGLSYHQEHSRELVGQILRSWLGVKALGEPKVVRAALEEKLSGLGGRDPDGTALLGLLLGLESDPLPLPGVSDRQRIQAAIDRSIQSILMSAQSRPTILVVEDLHWADAASCEYLAQLASGMAGASAPIMVLAQARPGVMLPETAVAQGLDRTLITIRPFSEREAYHLVDSLSTGHAALDPSMIQALVTRAEGNPMVLRELVRAHLEGGSADSELTPSLKGLVASRLDRLLPVEREVLEWAAVIGRVFDPTLLRSLSGLSDLPAILLALTERELIRPAELDGYAFTQAIIHEVVYHGILHRRRRELHRRVGDALERACEQSDIQSPKLAQHFLRAGDAPKALEYLQRAAALSKLTYANQEARTYLREALDLLAKHQGSVPDKRRDLLVMLADVESTLGDYPSALCHLCEALHLTSNPAMASDLMRSQGAVHERLGGYPMALCLYEQAHSRLQEGHEVRRSALLVDRAWIHVRNGHLQTAKADCQAALALLQGRQALVETARAYSVLGIACYRENRWNEARSHHAEALALRERAGDLGGIASSLNNLGMVEVEIGCFAEAEGHYMRAHAIYQRIGDPGYIATVLNNLGDLCARQGELRGAERYHRDALAIRRKLGDRFGVAASLCALGEALRLRGELEQARISLKEGLCGLEAIGEAELLAEAWEALGNVEWAARDYAAARGWLERAHEEAEKAGDRLRLGSVARAQAQIALELGDLAGARQKLLQADQALSAANAPLERARLLAVESRVLRAEGRHDEARRTAEAADALFASLGAERERHAQIWYPGDPRDPATG